MADFSLDNWMANLSPVIGKRKLTELYIPGSHNSAINEDCLTTHYPFPLPQFPTAIGPDAPETIIEYAKYIPVSLLIGSIIRAWGVMQKLSFHDQLLKGIRYFDLRITKVSGEFKFTHTLVSYTDIFTLLSPVGSFMREHDKEVLILDCQHFYDINDADCDQLLDGFHSLFGDLLCTSDEINVSHTSFETYIKHNKRILLIWKKDYANKLSSHNRSLVYEREETLKSEWPNGKDKKEDLAPFLLSEYARKESSDPKLFVLQGILDVSNFEWKQFWGSDLLTYEADLNEYLSTHLLPQLNTGKGFIYMVDNVSHPDDEATKKIIQLNANLQ